MVKDQDFLDGLEYFVSCKRAEVRASHPHPAPLTFDPYHGLYLKNINIVVKFEQSMGHLSK